jgi:NCAIR mutase (PurE)-related protein
MTAVLSPGSTTADRKAAFGAMSMEANEDRTTRKKIDQEREDGAGMRERAIADGRCVKTIVRTRPMRLDRDAATKDEAAERMPVAKKREPSEPAVRPNLE